MKLSLTKVKDKKPLLFMICLYFLIRQ